MKRFERSNGLDTALYKNYLYLFLFFNREVQGCDRNREVVVTEVQGCDHNREVVVTGKRTQ